MSEAAVSAPVAAVAPDEAEIAGGDPLVECPTCGALFQRQSPGPFPHRFCPWDGSALRSLVGRELPSGYVIEAPVGAGGLGVVYRARSAHGEDIEAAVKILKPVPGGFAQRIEDFLFEASTIQRVGQDWTNIPHIRVVDAGPWPHIVMDFVRGETLEAISRREKSRLPLVRVRQHLRGIAQALKAIHSAGHIHHDLKLNNVIVSQGRAAKPEDRVKVLDFGVSLRASKAETDGSHSIVALPSTHVEADSTNRIAGTLPFMAPETFEGRNFIATDFYQYGIAAYMLLAGRYPYHEPNAAQLHRRQDLIEAWSQLHRNAAPYPLRLARPETPRRLRRLVRRCLEKNPERRYANADQILHELREPLSRGARLGLLLAILALVSLLSLTAFLWVEERSRALVLGQRHAHDIHVHQSDDEDGTIHLWSGPRGPLDEIHLALAADDPSWRFAEGERPTFEWLEVRPEQIDPRLVGPEPALTQEGHQLELRFLRALPELEGRLRIAGRWGPSASALEGFQSEIAVHWDEEEPPFRGLRLVADAPAIRRAGQGRDAEFAVDVFSARGATRCDPRFAALEVLSDPPLAHQPAIRARVEVIEGGVPKAIGRDLALRKDGPTRVALNHSPWLEGETVEYYLVLEDAAGNSSQLRFALRHGEGDPLRSVTPRPQATVSGGVASVRFRVPGPLRAIEIAELSGEPREARPWPGSRPAILGIEGAADRLLGEAPLAELPAGSECCLKLPLAQPPRPGDALWLRIWDDTIAGQPTSWEMELKTE